MSSAAPHAAPHAAPQAAAPSIPRTVRIVLLAAASLALLACSFEFSDDSGPLQTRDQAFAWSGVVRPGATVMVREMRGGIEVVPGTDDTVRITARTEWRSGDPDRTLHFSASPDADGVLVCAVWGDGSCTKDKYQANVKFGRRGGSTDAKVFFRVEVPAGVLLDLVTIDGDVVAAASAPVRARSMNGDVTVVTAVGPVRGETMNGSVDIRMTTIAGSDSVIATTLNGDAYVFLPAVLDAVVDMSVTSGSSTMEFPMTSTGRNDAKHVQGVLGAGGRVVKIRSLNGSVALRRLDAEGRSYP